MYIIFVHQSTNRSQILNGKKYMEDTKVWHSCPDVNGHIVWNGNSKNRLAVKQVQFKSTFFQRSDREQK